MPTELLLDPEHRRDLTRMRFPQPLEREFAAEAEARSLTHLRVIFAVLVLLFTMGLVFYPSVEKESQTGVMMIEVRIAVWLAALIATWLRPLRGRMESVAGLAALLHTLIVHPVLWLDPPDPAEVEKNVYLTVAVRSLDLFVFCTLLRLRLRLASLLAAVSLLSFFGAYLIQTPITRTSFELSMLIVIGAMLIALTTTYHLELLARSDFLHSRLLAEEREKSERLLLNILPEPVATRLKNDPQALAETHSSVSVLFADLVNFTPLAANLPPAEVVSLLNEVFTEFDHLTERRDLEKIKTIGDCYMAVGGLPTPQPNHLVEIAGLALEMQATAQSIAERRNIDLKLRIGIHTGPVVAGVIGKSRFIYDLWGDTVNIASRMESLGSPGSIHVTRPVYEGLRDLFHFEPRAPIEVKGKGQMHTFWLAHRAGNPAEANA